MQIGFYTSALSDQPIEEIARWAVGAGFDTLEIDVESHIGEPTHAPAVIDTVRRAGIDVCALTFFGNLLDPDLAARERARMTVRGVVDAAAEASVGMVITFPGRDDSATEDDNYRSLADYYNSLADRAARGNVKILLENWPGPHNNYLATTPAGWARLFELAPAPNLGLNFDPSHLIWQGIDPEQALRAVADRVFLAHAKDTEIFDDRLQQTGYFGQGWWTYRLPGHGRLDWGDWLAQLRAVGFDGIVSVEHEDKDWGWPEGTIARRQEGLLEALHVLQDAGATGRES